jgi:hypothetical protein
MNIRTTLKDFDEVIFSEWFKKVAKPDIDYSTTLRMALDSMEEDHEIGTDPSYELGSQYTQSGNPEVFYL